MIEKTVIDEMKELKPFHTEDLIKDLYSWQEFEHLINLRPFVNSKRFHIITDKIFNWQPSFWASDKFSYPIDVIMSRQIAQNISISQAYKQGALWKGFSICAFRAVLVNSINFSIYEFVMKNL